MISIWIAFLAGLVSFLTPCVISLVPAYVSYLGGRGIAKLETSEKPNKMTAFWHGLAFVLGFSVIFILFGVVVSTLRQILFELTFWLSRVGGVIVVIFGIHMTGLIRIPFLDYDLRPKLNEKKEQGLFTSFLMGIFFSAGWSPCVGPILGSILTLAATGNSVLSGAVLLAVYSIGMAIPFLAAALGIGWVTTLLKKHQKALHIIEIGMGILLIIMGIMLFLGTFQQLKSFGVWIDFGI